MLTETYPSQKETAYAEHGREGRAIAAAGAYSSGLGPRWETTSTNGIPMNVLLIEDENAIAHAMAQSLADLGYAVEHSDNGSTGLARILAGQFDVVVLDVVLPGMDGFEVLQAVREARNTTPVIILSSQVELESRLRGFEFGADDYLPKPFFFEELVARLKLVTSRKRAETQTELRHGDLWLNCISREVRWQGVSVVLSQREFMLLEYLMRSPTTVFSREQILKHVWNLDFDPETNVVDVCIQRIKNKLSRREGMRFSLIQCVRKTGYRMRS